MLFPVFQYCIDHGYAQRDYVYPEGYVTHRVLVDTIEKGTAGEFALAMQNHLRPSLEQILGLAP